MGITVSSDPILVTGHVLPMLKIHYDNAAASRPVILFVLVPLHLSLHLYLRQPPWVTSVNSLILPGRKENGDKEEPGWDHEGGPARNHEEGPGRNHEERPGRDYHEGPGRNREERPGRNHHEGLGNHEEIQKARKGPP
ncbi:uncharacterized protein F5891DRAFT_986929 [Suillus fuscotomentosus]|uniref:Uncharacterized protein n=1 Tax=Suillus fuscotomentosus TaxID=1912939 RepID=A0AAD4HE90_9AGAM|nr:uncharacterized protein F5891DRAFT_986929 [Suillus fuscotomentosus]KAG1890584.1 hypothetical protein F5891DRAFT_986929 [Suillus fuscotomentosus]